MCFLNMPHWFVIFILSLLLISPGCRNRATTCQPGCYPSPFGGITGSTTVPSPQTYSIQIPGNSNQQYYNNGATAQQLPPLQPTGTLPTANGSNTRNGWQPVGATGTTGTLPVSTPPPSGSTSQLQSTINQSNLVSVVDRGTSQPGNRLAQTSGSGNGLSQTNNSNFGTTAVDERLDRSRLPVTDASQVRAPTNFSPTTTVGQFNFPWFNTNPYQGNTGYLPQFPSPQNTNAGGQQQTGQATNPNFGGTQPNVVVGNFSQPTFAQPSPQIYRGLATQYPQVLAQSTVYADPAKDPNFQNGWRDRDLTTAGDSLNR